MTWPLIKRRFTLLTLAPLNISILELKRDSLIRANDNGVWCSLSIWSINCGAIHNKLSSAPKSWSRAAKWTRFLPRLFLMSREMPFSEKISINWRKVTLNIGYLIPLFDNSKRSLKFLYGCPRLLNRIHGRVHISEPIKTDLQLVKSFLLVWDYSNFQTRMVSY